MALRNQPYIPLYVQDFLTDEKLNECSAQSVGVYIKIMCIMHKSDEYGTILLKQKDKQTLSTVENFALKLIKHLPFDLTVIKNAISELVAEGVLTIDGEKLFQKRMVKDNSISEKRSLAGSEGGKRTQFAKAKSKANGKAKVKANSEYENVNVNVIKDVIDYLNDYGKKKFTLCDPNKRIISARINEGFSVDDLKCVIRKKIDEWDNTEMAKYIRPETLFNATKFQGYLNQPEKCNSRKAIFVS